MQALAESGEPFEIHTPEPMPRAWIEAVHDPAYVEQVIAAAVPREKERRIGFAITPRIARRSLLSAGGTYLAARIALERGCAANAAGGSHHALADTGAGYCVLNDLAIAANRLIAEGHAHRILILDLDVHQGDGTASLTAGREDIFFTLSLHAEKNFPARKARSSRDVPLPDAIGDEAYLAVLADELPAAIHAFRPDFILHQAGVDPHDDDRLGRLALTDRGLSARDTYVGRIAAGHGLPIASTLGGGYGEDRMEVARRHARAMLTLDAAYASISREGQPMRMSIPSGPRTPHS